MNPIQRLTFQAERARASLELTESAPTDVVVASQRRHDVIAEAARAGAQVACRPGCHWCCHFRVAAQGQEILALAEWLHDHLPPAQVDLITRVATKNAERLAPLTHDRRMRTNLACPLLFDRQCVAWEARPMACRAFHATDVEGCEASFWSPERSDIPTAYLPDVADTSRGHRDGLARATADRGFDSRYYELNAGLSVALTHTPDPGAVPLFDEPIP